MRDATGETREAGGMKKAAKRTRSVHCYVVRCRRDAIIMRLVLAIKRLPEPTRSQVARAFNWTFSSGRKIVGPIREAAAVRTWILLMSEEPSATLLDWLAAAKAGELDKFARIRTRSRMHGEVVTRTQTGSKR